jgi:hypothetical protein
MDDIFRLATFVMKMNQDFSETVHKKGFTRAFGGVQPAADVLSGHTPNPEDGPTPDHDTDLYSSVETSTPEAELTQYPEL